MRTARTALRFSAAALLFSLACAPPSFAATINAASCSQANVTSAITSAANGDIVQVPAGNCTWSAMTLSKGIHLKGAGSASTIITVTGQLDITKNATNYIEISGFTFQASNLGSAMFGLYGTWTAKPFLIHDNIFTVNTAGIMRIETNGGVIYKNTLKSTRAWNNGFSDDPGIQHKLGTADANASWPTPDTMGTHDDGTKNLYVEDNIFDNMATVGTDFDDGARAVVRYNTFTNTSFNSHGLDTSPVGVRHYEIYNNTWLYPDNMANLPWVIWLRGGTGAIFNNAIPNVTGQEWGDIEETQLSIRMVDEGGALGCATSYPAPHQVGWGHNGTSQILDPIRFWNNTGAGANAIGIRRWDNSCGNDMNVYLQAGREWTVGTPKPGYTPFAYPHPLRTDAAPDTEVPSNVSGLSATAINAAQVNLSWSAATDNIGINGYDIERCAGSACSNFSQVQQTSGTGTTASNTGLSVSTLYRYRVKARDAAGNVSAAYSNIAEATTQAASAPPTLPEGNGLAAAYLNDSGIAGNSAVLFADGFETYTALSQLTSSGNWNSYFQSGNLAIDTATYFGGAKSLRLRMPNSGASEVSNAIVRPISPSRDLLYVRVYVRYAADYSGVTAAHNGIRITANYTGPGTIPNGSDFFYVSVEQSRYRSEAEPGYTNAYVYFPEQNDNYGEHWYPSGFTGNGDGPNGGFGSYFVARTDIVPTRGQWICYEAMVQANTPGARDGRIAVWQNGSLIADWQNIRFRDVDTVKINEIQFENGGQGSNQVNDKWIDNIVVATSYIGPLGSLLSAPANLRWLRR